MTTLKTREQLRTLRKTIGTHIHLQRHGRKMLLQELAHKAGLHTNTLDRYEMGKGALRLEELTRIASALNMKLSDFFIETQKTR